MAVNESLLLGIVGLQSLLRSSDFQPVDMHTLGAEFVCKNLPLAFVQ
jgi:hypothetical protein